jgi:hypothetical protein
MIRVSIAPLGSIVGSIGSLTPAFADALPKK